MFEDFDILNFICRHGLMKIGVSRIYFIPLRSGIPLHLLYISFGILISTHIWEYTHTHTYSVLLFHNSQLKKCQLKYFDKDWTSIIFCLISCYPVVLVVYERLSPVLNPSDIQSSPLIDSRGEMAAETRSQKREDRGKWGKKLNEGMKGRGRWSRRSCRSIDTGWVAGKLKHYQIEDLREIPLNCAKLENFIWW